MRLLPIRPRRRCERRSLRTFSPGLTNHNTSRHVAHQSNDDTSSQRDSTRGGPPTRGRFTSGGDVAHRRRGRRGRRAEQRRVRREGVLLGDEGRGGAGERFREVGRAL
eukprot:31120-Pelagococcus_subviridis.AAC.8